MFRCAYRHSITSAALGVFALVGYAANAQLLINPTGGTTLTFGDTDDGVVAGRSLGFTGQFFGVNKTTVDVTTNGSLNFSADNDYHNNSMPTAVARINTLFDDMDISTGSAIEKVNAGISYSITWSEISSRNFDGTDTFQAVWFGAATTINGFQFQKDDIAFSYAKLDAGFRITGASTDAGATVGLDKGNSSNFTAIPGDADGLITPAQKNLIPVNDGRFILFRVNGQGGYNGSVAPAPSALLAFVIGAVPGIGLLLRRRRQ